MIYVHHLASRPKRSLLEVNDDVLKVDRTFTCKIKNDNDVKLTIFKIKHTNLFFRRNYEL